MLASGGSLFDNTDYSMIIGVDNNTSNELFLADRLGMISRLGPRTGRVSEGFNKVVVKVNIRVSQAYGGNIYSSGLGDASQAIRKHLERINKECLGRSYNEQIFMNSPWEGSMSFEYDPPQGSSYISDPVLGILIGRTPDLMPQIRKEGLWSHGALNRFDKTHLGDEPVIPALSPEEESVLQAKVFVVDKQHRLGTLWTNILGDLVSIPVVRHSSLEDGVYIDTRITGTESGRTHYIKFEGNYVDELKKFNIHLDEPGARFSQTNKYQIELEAKLKTANTELKKKTRELEELKRVMDSTNSETKLFKANKSSNTILDSIKLLISFLGPELKRGLFSLLALVGF